MASRKMYSFMLLLTIPTAFIIVINTFFYMKFSHTTSYSAKDGRENPIVWPRMQLQPKIQEPSIKRNVKTTYQRSDEIGEPSKYNLFDDETVNKLLSDLKAANSIKFGDFDIKKLEDRTKKRRKVKSLKRDTLSLYMHEQSSDIPNWKRFLRGIKRHELYDSGETYIDNLLRDMTSEPIVGVEVKDGGTQLKLTMTFKDGGRALFKPMRFSRNVGTLPNHFVFNDYERHYAEIAAFHLDRILGFNGVPPVAGRKVNMTRDIRQLIDKESKKTFFISPAGNICFYSKCKYYCDSSHAICGKPDMLEGSFATFLPEKGDRIKWKNPWKRAYSKTHKAYWEVYDDLCDRVRVLPPFNTGRRLLDLMDLHVFDFITGNWDRHHYETLKHFGNDTFMLRFDNGRAFGKPTQDDLTVLAPINQCCLIRYSTFIKLVSFYLGPNHLSVRMRDSLNKDSVSPILTESHFPAMDRRVMKILKAIADCIMSGKIYTDVIVDDEF